MVYASYYLPESSSVKLLNNLKPVKEVITDDNFVESSISIEAVIVISS